MIGHNNPPSALEQMQSDSSSLFEEINNWCDGSKVENEEQVKAVDDLLAHLKEIEKEAKAARESEYRPHKNAADKVASTWKPFLDDIFLQRKGLTSLVQDYKIKLRKEKEEAERKAREEANRLKREAEEAARLASQANIEVQREAQQKIAEAQLAQGALASAKRDKVKGLRKTKEPEITDMRAVVNWIAANDRPAMANFAEQYVKSNFKELEISGVIIKEVTTAF